MNKDLSQDRLKSAHQNGADKSAKPFVLLVEDNTINQIVISEELNHLGFRSDIAEDGQKGFEMWLKGDYDLILTDCNMPVMTGYDMVTRIRAEEQKSQKLARIPIIAISGNKGHSEDKRCFSVGMDDVLSKPIELNTLKACLDNWLVDGSQKVARQTERPSGEKSSPQPNANAVVDLSVLSRLVGDDPDTHRRLLSQFIRQATDDISELVKAFENKSTKDVVAASHRLKSSSRSIGAFNLSEYCASMELKASLIDWHVLDQLKTELLSTWGDVKSFLDSGEPQRQSEKDYSDLTLLVIDDDQYMLDLVQATFHRMGINNVICASSGERALGHLENDLQVIDIIFCDLNMPKMDGIELLRTFAEKQFTGGVALISSEDIGILRAAERLARAHGLNVLGKISKPLTPNALDELLLRYTPSADKKKRNSVGLLTKDMLCKAIEEDQIEVYFQPQINISTNKIEAVEALARWKHPKAGSVSPKIFIPLAESCGAINRLMEIVYEKAIIQAGRWARAGLSIKVSVNLSIDNLTRMDLPEFLYAMAEKQRVNPENVVLEITESRLLNNVKRALDVLTRLRLKGFGLSIDDFGTGYSSMEQLLNIPFTELKIDRAFVHGATKDPAARAILESSVNLAKKLDLFIVAEGTEDKEDVECVRALGCNLAQGYHYSEPMPVEEFDQWLKLSA